MPITINRYQQQTLPQSGGMPRASVLPLNDDSGQSLYRLGAELQQLNTQFTKARREADLNDRIGRATAELAELELGFENDQDFRTAGDRFNQAAQDIRNRHLDSLDDAAVKSAFTKQFQQLSLAKSINVRKGALKKERDYNVASLDTSLDVYATQAANAKNPAERELVVNQARLAMASAQTGGWISAVDAGNRERKFLSRMDEATVLRDMSIDPSMTADKLALDPSYAVNIDPVQREKWADQAYRRSESERVREDRRVERERKQRGDEIMKQAWEMLEKGSLTREFVQNARPYVEPGEYHSLIKGMKEGGSGRNDESALADLNRILYVENNPQEAERKAFQYQKAGLLKSTTLGTFLSTTRSHSRQEGPRSPFEREKAFIVNALKPSVLVPDPASNARFALALREFEDYGAANPNATQSDLRAKADGIIKDRSIVDMVQIAEKTGLSARNNPQATLDDIRERGAALLQQKEQGRISDTEYRKKAAELNRARVAAEQALNQGAGRGR
jgi:hypothetical protein